MFMVGYLNTVGWEPPTYACFSYYLASVSILPGFRTTLARGAL